MTTGGGAAAAKPGAVRELSARAARFWDLHPGWAGYPLLLALVWLSRPASWREPISHDPGQYIYVGQTILDGGTPYADAANNKGPLLYLLFAAIKLASGTSVAGMRIALALLTALAALAVAGYVARAAGRAAGVFAGIAFAVLSSAVPLDGDYPNSTQLGAAPVAGAWYLATRPGARWALAAGAASGAAIAINVTLAVVVPFVAWELWRSAGPGGHLRRLASAAVGGLAVLAPLAIWIGAAGALDDLYENVFEQIERTGGAAGVQARSAGGELTDLHFLFDVPAGGLWAAGLLGAVIAARERRLRAPAVAAALWIIVSWLRVKSASYEFVQHYYPGLIGIVAGLALGVASLWGTRLRDRVSLGALVLVLAAWPYVVSQQFKLLDLKPWLRGDPVMAEQAPVSDFVRANTRSKDRIQVVGSTAQIYWLSDRRAPTPWFDENSLRGRPDWLRERGRRLLADPPAAVVALAPYQPEADVIELLTRRHYKLAYDVRGARVWLLAGAEKPRRR